MNGTVEKIFKWCRHYLTLTFIGVVAVVVYLSFFTENSVVKKWEYEKEIARLEAEIKESKDTLEYYNRLNNSLSTDRDEMERIVRERYHMQRPNEDVYVFE